MVIWSILRTKIFQSISCRVFINSKAKIFEAFFARIPWSCLDNNIGTKKILLSRGFMAVKHKRNSDGEVFYCIRKSVPKTYPVRGHIYTCLHLDQNFLKWLRLHSAFFPRIHMPPVFPLRFGTKPLLPGQAVLAPLPFLHCKNLIFHSAKNILFCPFFRMIRLNIIKELKRLSYVGEEKRQVKFGGKFKSNLFLCPLHS